MGKKRGVKKPFSTEPLNLTNRNSARYNGLVNAKAVGVTATPDNKGFVLTTRKCRMAHKPGKSLHKTKGSLIKQRYRKDLSKAAMRRAAAIVRSQKPLPKRKGSNKGSAKKE